MSEGIINAVHQVMRMARGQVVEVRVVGRPETWRQMISNVPSSAKYSADGATCISAGQLTLFGVPVTVQGYDKNEWPPLPGIYVLQQPGEVLCVGEWT